MDLYEFKAILVYTELQASKGYIVRPCLKRGGAYVEGGQEKGIVRYSGSNLRRGWRGQHRGRRANNTKDI